MPLTKGLNGIWLATAAWVCFKFYIQFMVGL